MAGVNPFRRKQMQILGLDNASFVSTRSTRSSDDGSSTISHFSDRASAASTHSRSNSTRKASVTSPHGSIKEDDSDGEKRSHSVSEDAKFYSAYGQRSLEDVPGSNPFEVDEEADSLDELDDTHVPIRRRRTVPSKAASRLGAESDNPWLSSTMIGNHPSHRQRQKSPDTTMVPLKAQKTLGISRQGQPVSIEDYRRTNALSPSTENVAPKAQRMLGIPSNPFSRGAPQEERHFFHDELEREGSRGPTSASRKPMNVEEFQRMILSGERNPHFPTGIRDSGSNTDISSLSRSSILSSQPDTHIETPRSSHEFHSRPTLTRIATDSALHDSSSGISKPWAHDQYSPMDVAESPILNKPLPKTPEHTFELAGSDTGHAARRKKARQGVPDPIEELPSPQMIVELPAEPVVYHEMDAGPVPGSAAAPIELPAREASPIDPPTYKWQSLNFGPRNAPAPPPPRRSQSTRSSVDIPRLSSPASESALYQKTKPTPPPARGSSSRFDRSIAQTLPPTNTPSPEPSRSPSIKNAPQPPSRVSSGSTGSSETKTSDSTATERPKTPERFPPKPKTNSPQSRLPPLQTTTLKSSSRDFSNDHPVSAVTRDSGYTVSTVSPGGVSVLSPSSPASRRAGLSLISKAAGLPEKKEKAEKVKEGGSNLANEVKPSPREPKPSHTREWSWEPGKIDRIDSIRKGDKEKQEYTEEMKVEEKIDQTIEEVDEESEGEQEEEKPSHSKTEDDKEKEGEEGEREEEEERVDVLKGLDDLKRDVDDAIKGQKDRNADVEAKSPNVEEKEGQGESSPTKEETKPEGHKVPQGNWI